MSQLSSDEPSSTTITSYEVSGCAAKASAASCMNRGRFSASSFAGTSTDTSARRGSASGAYATSDSRRSVVMRGGSYTLPHARGQHAELVAILGDRAPGDMHAAFLEDVDDGLVGERVLRI